MKKLLLIILPFLIVSCSKQTSPSQLKAEKELLGKAIFFDTSLSKNGTQACATCHNPLAGFADDRQTVANGAVSLGDDGVSFGDRNTPAIAYSFLTPAFYFDKKDKKYKGGQFLDGRSKTLREQAVQPFINPIEMGLNGFEQLVQKVSATHKKEFIKIYGKGVFDDTKTALNAIGDALAYFEAGKNFGSFNSKYDRYLQGKYELTELEELGMSLFFSEKNTNCASCHAQKWQGHKRELFTNFEYKNIGVPINAQARQLSKAGTDNGLFQNNAVNDALLKGKFKTPTLRNIAVTAPYMHNGALKTLKEVVEFYDKYNNLKQTDKWQPAEIANTIDKKELKAKKLTDKKVKALVAFMQTLTDKQFEHLNGD